MFFTFNSLVLSILTQQVFNFFGQENPLTKYSFQTPAGVS